MDDENFFTQKGVAELGDARSYASRLFDYGGSGRDQLAWVIDRLRADPASRSATITTFERLSDSMLYPVREHAGFLGAERLRRLIVYAHSLDFGKKAYRNLVELAHLQRTVAAGSGSPSAARPSSSSRLRLGARTGADGEARAGRRHRDRRDLTTTRRAFLEPVAQSHKRCFGRRIGGEATRAVRREGSSGRRRHGAGVRSGGRRVQRDLRDARERLRDGAIRVRVRSRIDEGRRTDSGHPAADRDATFVIPSPGTKVTVAVVSS